MSALPKFRKLVPYSAVGPPHRVACGLLLVIAMAAFLKYVLPIADKPAGWYGCHAALLNPFCLGPPTGHANRHSTFRSSPR